MMAGNPQNIFSPANRALLSSADRSQVVSTLANITLSSSGEWLKSSNVYLHDAHMQIKADNNTIPAAQISDFSEYLTAGAFVHCGDAWSYFGRAIDALIRGDLHAAVHLTYYAELRGAFSVLASEGIYIGDGANFILDSTGQPRCVTHDRTHVAAWKYFDAWSGAARSSSLVEEILRPGGVKLHEWTQNISGQPVQTVVTDLLSRIAFDLQAFTADRQRRNRVSYNPTRLIIQDLDTQTLCSMVSKIWVTLEPDTKGGFPVLDQLLLRDILSTVYTSLYPELDASGAANGQTDWSKWISWLEILVPSQNRNTAFHEELKIEPSKPIGSSILAPLFNRNPNAILPLDYIDEMLARTSVLLRLATGSCVLLHEQSGLPSDAIFPWVESLSLARGLWAEGDLPDNMLDLWSDVDEARQILDAETGTRLQDLIFSLGMQISSLGQTERIIAWSFA